MKKEIKCPRCRRRIQKEDAYCQYCGCHVAEEKKKKRKKKHNLLLKHKEVGVPRKAFGPSQLLFISDTDVSIQAIRHPSRTYSDESRNRRCIIRSVGRA